MRWPWRSTKTVASEAQSIAASRFVDRRNYNAELRERLERRESIVIFGPPRQGKTTLVARHLNSDNSIYVECQPGFKRTQIYRLILSNLGYAITLESKSRRKGSCNIDIGLFGNKFTGAAEGEMEKNWQQINIDLGNASEVAHLISRIPEVPCIIFNHFDLLDKNTQINLLFDLVFFIERSKLRFVIVGSWTNDDYLDVLESSISGKISRVMVDFWSPDEMREFYAIRAHVPW